MAELKAQTSAANYAMGQNNALKSYYGALLENPNVQRGLATIKATEGTAQKADPYSTAFGGGKIPSFTDHPGISYGFRETTGKKNRTTAAGAYQFLSRTWKSMSKKLGLTDFGPLSQDIAALGLIDQAGGLAALVAGDVKGFVSKVNGVWASLPGAPYAQPTKSWGFVEDAWSNALNPMASMPDTAPTPYSRDDPQSFADARPDNQNNAGPKGLFSVDTGTAKAIGHVSRSPLGPATPSRPSFSGLGTPRGVNTAAPSRPSVSGFTSQDEKANTGSYKNAPNAGNFTSQDERESFATRMGIPGAVAPSASTPSPAPPSTLGGLNYSNPKGIFSVDPGAKVQASIAPTSTPAATIGPAAPTIGMPATPARPALAPVPAVSVPAAVPAVARVAPPAPSVSRQSLAPARPALSPSAVYGGAVGTAQTSTPGTTVSRANSYGPTYTTNKFGAVTAVAPDGTQMAAWGGVPASKPAIAGPLGQQGINAPPATGAMFGPKAKSATGMVTGAAIGGYALGPLGAMLGGLIGKNVAQGKAPLSGLLGGSNNANTHVVDTFDGPMRFANAQGGLGFPSAPSNPGGLKANSSNNSASGMRGISPGAAGAIGRGEGGLY